MVRRASRGRRQMPTRKFIWAREHIDATVNAQDASMFDLLDEFQTEYGANLVGATVMRLRGRLEFEPVGASSSFSAAGVRVVSQAFLNKTASHSQADGPFSDQHADWMAYEPLIFNDADPTLQIHRWEVDVKSNRKLEELAQALVLIVENSIVGASLLVRGTISVGLKLP